MKTYRSKFEENYRAIKEPSHNKKGFKMTYVYVGPWYVWNVPKTRVQTVKRLTGAACLLSVILFGSGSLLDSFLNCSRYVEFFGILSVAALLYEVIGVIQFCTAKEQMTNMDFEDIKNKMMIAPLLHAALLLGAVAAAVCLFFSHTSGLTDIIVTLCYFFSGLLSLLIFSCYRSLPWRKDKNENMKIGLHAMKRETDC